MNYIQYWLTVLVQSFTLTTRSLSVNSLIGAGLLKNFVFLSPTIAYNVNVREQTTQ